MNTIPSHEYEYSGADFVRIAFAPWIVTACLGILIRVSLTVGILPDPQPAWDLDQTILTHQTTAAQRRHDASTLLLGDSSGLMNLDAKILSTVTGRSTLNLSTLSFIDLDAQSILLERYLESNPAPKTIVLVLHPEAIRRNAASDYHGRLLRNNLANEDTRRSDSFRDRLLWLLGFEQSRARVLSRVIARPLPSEFGSYYGFTHDLWRHMDRRNGSATDPSRFDPQSVRGSAEFRLAPGLEKECAAFRRRVPAETRLVLLVSPIHKSLATTRTENTLTTIRAQLAAWLDAEVPGTMPFVMPDSQFATTTHLNESAASAYTTRLGDAIR